MFIVYIYACRRPVYVKEISGRFDVGNLQSYLDCIEHFKPRQLLILYFWYVGACVVNSHDVEYSLLLQYCIIIIIRIFT